MEFLFWVVAVGALLGMAGNALSGPGDEQGAPNPRDPEPSPSPRQVPTEATSLVPPDAAQASAELTAAKDCKSCGGHSQTGKFCSFCGRAL